MAKNRAYKLLTIPHLNLHVITSGNSIWRILYSEDQSVLLSPLLRNPQPSQLQCDCSTIELQSPSEQGGGELGICKLFDEALGIDTCS